MENPQLSIVDCENGLIVADAGVGDGKAILRVTYVIRNAQMASTYPS